MTKGIDKTLDKPSKRRNTIRLSTKLIGGFTLVILLTSLACYLGYSGLRSLELELAHISADKRIYGDAQKIKNVMLQHRRYEKDLFLNIGNHQKQVDKYVPKLEAKEAEIQSLLINMKQVIHDDPRFSPEVKQIANELPHLHQRYMEGLWQVSEKAIEDGGLPPQEANAMMMPYKVPIHNLEEGIDQVASAATELFEQRIETSKQVGARSRMAMIVGTVVALVPCPFIILWVTGPLRKVSKMLADIAQAEGDLTRRLPVEGNDEVGELSQWFNTFVDQVQQVVIRVGGSATSLVESSSRLTSTAGDLTGQADSTTDRSSRVVAAADQMSVRMSEASRSTQTMQTNISTVANAIEELATCIQDISGNTEQASSVAGQAASELEQSNVNIAELSSAAAEISRVTETIEDIAEQTNLLALNATIEAARAGEAGKGFSIVANEVKELARQAAAATEDIRQRITAIQDATEKTTRSIGDIGRHVAQVNEFSTMIAAAIQEQNCTTQSIAEHINQTSAAVTLISDGVTESAQVSEEIRASMVVVDQSARETASGASSAKATGDDLHRIADELQTLMGSFRV
ncbi:methyl-accepting chemotaxis protein [Bremerella sp. JC770]|uniref:methyl-accepting chemotaxis protein n=1 Tax=Bremerella sp. JC770 TaxID=3232137 RepID=UPI0034577792